MTATDWTRYFSDDYATAKERFIAAATQRGGELTTYAIGDDPDYTIDVAIMGAHSSNQTTVVSSGLHGVEGFFGSAVQLAWLDHLPARLPTATRVVLIHVINPVGFARRRRWNEDNVDLNRNFCLRDDDYQGSPASYAAFDSLLNPKSPPRRFEPFIAKAIWQIFRHGLPAVKQAVAGGQYEYPQGCFFGGHRACESTKVIQVNYNAWIGDSREVVHLDLHTGLGQSAKCKLLIEETIADNSYPWYVNTFGSSRVEASQQDASLASAGTAYETSGSFGRWLHAANQDRRFRFSLAEFGTYGVLRVLSALRAENRAHFYAPHDSKVYRQSKKELLECFCPASPQWRNQVVQTGMQIIEDAIHADCDR